MLELVEIARLSHRPSDLLEMREAGYGPAARLSLDRAYVNFAAHFERMRDARKEVPAPKPSRKPKHTMLVPVHSKEELLRVLDIDPAEAEATPSIVPDVVRVEDWDAVPDWGDDVPLAGGED